MESTATGPRLNPWFSMWTQLQGFSAWKALGNTVLAGLVIMAPILLLVLVTVSLA